MHRVIIFEANCIKSIRARRACLGSLGLSTANDNFQIAVDNRDWPWKLVMVFFISPSSGGAPSIEDYWLFRGLILAIFAWSIQQSILNIAGRNAWTGCRTCTHHILLVYTVEHTQKS